MKCECGLCRIARARRVESANSQLNYTHRPEVLMDKPLKKVQVAALFVSVLLCCWVVRLYASPEEGKPLKDYDAIVIGDFTVEQNEATKDVPESAPAELQKAVLKAVKQRGPFKHVIDKAKDASPEAAVDDAEAPKKRVVLSA